VKSESHSLRCRLYGGQGRIRTLSLLLKRRSASTSLLSFGAGQNWKPSDSPELCRLPGTNPANFLEARFRTTSELPIIRQGDAESRQIQTAVRRKNADRHRAAQLPSIRAAARLPTFLSATSRLRSSSGLISENTRFISPECSRKAETMRSLPRWVRATIRTRRSSELTTRLARPLATNNHDFESNRNVGQEAYEADYAEESRRPVLP
jgi:hypothetical protein